MIQMEGDFNQLGYQYIPQAFDPNTITSLKKIVLKFHNEWIKRNQAWYEDKAINSAFLTKPDILNENDRQTLFNFIGSDQLIEHLKPIFHQPMKFLNTQLFFDPFHSDQKNYWHRDPQYHMTEDEQKQAFSHPDSLPPEVIHFRIPLTEDPGVEVIPTSHRRWDTQDELDVRLEKHNRKSYEDLPKSYSQTLNAGDLLVFSANMIHRGLYGGDRLALDIIFFEPNKGVESFVERQCLPNDAQIPTIDHPYIFEI